MRILIVAATWMEVKLLTDEFDLTENINETVSKYQLSENEIDILITGIGTTATTYKLTSFLLNNSYDFVMNLGIGGSLNRNLKIGEVVNVISEEFADLGVENEEKFLTLFESDFIELNEFPFENGVLKASNSNGWIQLNEVHGITANKSHCHRKSISEIQQKFSADVESMEGAAVFYVCRNLGIPCFQIRAISNYVDSGDASNWDIPAALINLKSTFLKLSLNFAVPVC